MTQYKILVQRWECRQKMKRLGNMALIIVFLLIAATFILGAGSTSPKEKPQLVTEIYIVREGDTLWNIAANFMPKNTYGRREIREFYSGIIELNYDEIFAGRVPGQIYPGDKLKINYWVASPAAGQEERR